MREHGTARARERSHALLEGAAERSRPRTVAERFALNARWMAQAALATALAWALARELFGHPRPIFAAVVALIGISTTLGHRRRYAAEMLAGVALGIGIADALVTLIGTGTVQIGAIVAGAMAAAVALGGSAVLISEAAVSALLVVTVQQPGTGLSGARFLDSLLGGVVALAVTSLLPANPVAAARRAALPLLAELAATLEDVARALERTDGDLADRTHARAKAIEPDALAQAITAGREMLRLAPLARGTRAEYARYADAATQIDTAITTVEALSRAVVRAITLGDNAPAPVPDALRDLAEAMRGLDASMHEPADVDAVREPAVRAAVRATLVLEQTANLSVSTIVVQVRAAAVDLLRGSGLARARAEQIVREATAARG